MNTMIKLIVFLFTLVIINAKTYNDVFVELYEFKCKEKEEIVEQIKQMARSSYETNDIQDFLLLKKKKEFLYLLMKKLIMNSTWIRSSDIKIMY